MNYIILDTGNNKRLEQIGQYILVRPYSQAIWKTKADASAWRKAHAEFAGNLDAGNGKWVLHGKISEDFIFVHEYFKIRCRLKDYGHTGIFPEQNENWRWIYDNAIPQASYLNLFAYTGASSFAASLKARVTHVDSSKAVVNWARENAGLSGVKSGRIRWIVEDAMTFVKREHKRGRKYEGVIMDPPTFGRGAEGEIWKIEENLTELLYECRNILSDSANFFLVSAHSPGISHHSLFNCLAGVFDSSDVSIVSGEMFLKEKYAQRIIPSGVFARWLKVR